MALSSDPSSSKLNVCLRIKPATEKNEAYAIENDLVKVNSYRGSESFQFTSIFKEDSTQVEVFDVSSKNNVDSFLNGQDCLVFAYGTTSAGKTYTVQGNKSEPGIIPRSIKHIFNAIGSVVDDSPRIAPYNYKQALIRNAQERMQSEHIKRSILSSNNTNCFVPPVENKFSMSFAPVLSSTVSEFNERDLSPAGDLPATFDAHSRCSLWISMLEVYNENVYDLLAPLPKGPGATRSTVKLLSDGMGNFIPQGNIEINVNNLSEANAVLSYGSKQRTTVATLLNFSSSRSHCILRVRLLRVDRAANVSPAMGALSPAADVDDFRVSTFMFIDLAGSERVEKAGTLKNRARETGNINNSLVVLGRCMEMLKLKGSMGGASKHSVVPYRDSKLTMLLQPLLSVSGPKSLLVNINTCSELFEETINVLKFSCVAKCVVFKEPAKPVAKSTIKVPSLEQVDTSSQNSSQGSETNTASHSNSVSSEQFEELSKVKEDLEKQLQKKSEENQMLKEALQQLKQERNKREKALHEEYGQMEEEMRNNHQEAMHSKEEQMITLMEDRLDNLTSFYEGELEKLKKQVDTAEVNLETVKADLEVKTSYIKTLESAVLDWESKVDEPVNREEIDQELSAKISEIERLSRINEELVLELNTLNQKSEGSSEALRLAQEERATHEAECSAEIRSLQNEVKTQLGKLSRLSETLLEKDLKLAALRESKKKLKETLFKIERDCAKLESNCVRYKKLTDFIVHEYHPSARESLATHNEEETWALIEKEFQLMPSKCKELEKEAARLREQLEFSAEDYKKLEQRRDAQLGQLEDELRSKNNQLEVEKREVQALQKQLMGMTPRKMDMTPMKVPEFKTPMAALSNSVRVMNFNSPSPSQNANRSMPTIKVPPYCDSDVSQPMTRSSGRKKNQALNQEKENSPLPIAPAKKPARKGRRKLCADSLHPALDSEEVDFDLPMDNELEKTRRRLRSTYK